MNFENTVIIPQERYEDLIKNESKLKIIHDIIIQDKSNYGFSECTSRAIETVMGLTRSIEE